MTASTRASGDQGRRQPVTNHPNRSRPTLSWRIRRTESSGSPSSLERHLRCERKYTPSKSSLPVFWYARFRAEDRDYGHFYDHIFEPLGDRKVCVKTADAALALYRKQHDGRNPKYGVVKGRVRYDAWSGLESEYAEYDVWVCNDVPPHE